MDVMVTLTNDDETNILVSLLAKKMGARKTITKVSKFGYFSLMNTIGLEQVVSTRLSAVNTILQHIRRGKVLSARTMTDEQAEVLEAVCSGNVGYCRTAPLKIPAFPRELWSSVLFGVMKLRFHPGESIIRPNDRIIVFAKRQVVPKIEKILSVKLEFF